MNPLLLLLLLGGGAWLYAQNKKKPRPAAANCPTRRELQQMSAESLAGSTEIDEVLFEFVANRSQLPQGSAPLYAKAAQLNTDANILADHYFYFVEEDCSFHRFEGGGMVEASGFIDYVNQWRRTPKGQRVIA